MNADWWRRFEGHWVDAFQLTRLLGAGGFGGVFLADHIVERAIVRRGVALKLIRTEERPIARQLEELIAAASLRHAHIIEYFHAGSVTLDRMKMLYLVMELAEQSLQTKLKAGLLTSMEVAELGGQMASALSYLHEQQRIHRDLKPGNVLRVGSAWKLSDFGLVRQSATDHTGTLMGTAQYMPPESFNGTVSTAWDIWSLGVVLLEALTGKRPFPGNLSESQLMLAIAHDEPNIPSGLARPFDEVVRGCLARDHRVRWKAQRVLTTLRDGCAPRPGNVRPAHASTLPGHYFISYAVEDASEFVSNLAMQLNAGNPAVKTWISGQDLKPGRNSDDQIEQAIEFCESVLFVMSRRSVNSDSPCRRELNYAMQCGKPVLPLLIQPGIKVPLSLSSLRCVDFTGDFDSALAQLRKHITVKPARSPEALAKFRKELADAELALEKAWRPGMRAELRNEIQRLETEIAFEEVIGHDPQGPEIALAREELNDLFVIVESRASLSEGVCALLSKAINHGAPIYNDGSHIGCAIIYDYAAKLVLRLLEGPEAREKLYQSVCARLQQVGFDAISPEIANHRAWQLRHSFDHILEALIPGMGTPP